MCCYKEILIIIPARAGSKRIKGKNRRLLNGVPLIEYSIKYAKKHIPGDIIISTDDKLIAPIANKLDVPILWRKNNKAKDETTATEVVQDVLNNLNKTYNYVILLQPTSPLRTKDLFKEAWKLFQNNSSKSLITVSPNKNKLGVVNNTVYFPKTYNFGERSQSLKPLYYENGSLYLFSYTLAKEGKMVCDSPLALIINHPFGTVDIDTEIDWLWAELIQKKYND